MSTRQRSLQIASFLTVPILCFGLNSNTWQDDRAWRKTKTWIPACPLDKKSLRFCLPWASLSIGCFNFGGRWLALAHQASENEKWLVWREKSGKRSSLMVSALVSGLGGPGLSPDQGHCIVVLGKTLYPHSASLHPGVLNTAAKLTYAHASTLTFPVCTFFLVSYLFSRKFYNVWYKQLYCCNRSLWKSMLPFSSISFNFLVRRFRKSLQQCKAVQTSESVIINRCFCSVVHDTSGLLSGYEVNQGEVNLQWATKVVETVDWIEC